MSDSPDTGDDDDPSDDEELLDADPEDPNAEMVSESVELWVKKAFVEPPRLDQYVASRHPDTSRAAVQRLIEDGGIHVIGRLVKASYRVQTGDCITLRMLRRKGLTIGPEDIPLDILYEDDDIVVLNKQANIIVHPGRGRRNWTGTLTNALVFHFQKLSTVGGEIRPGIVHRLDRDTTGVILVAKDDRIHQHLGLQFERRKVLKEYLAIAYGVPDRTSDYVEKMIGHHPSVREKMAIRDDPRFGKPAVTFYEVQQAFPQHSLFRLRPQTGRTHQLRLHLAHIGCPIVADRPYSGRHELRRSDLCPTLGPEEDEVLIARQALHAHRLRFYHPGKNELMDFTAPVPEDMRKTLEALEAYSASSPPDSLH